MFTNESETYVESEAYDSTSVVPIHTRSELSYDSVSAYDSASVASVASVNQPLPALFERVILRQKTVFLGPLKSPKNMLRKSIFIGLFVLNYNGTIGEPKSLQGG